MAKVGLPRQAVMLDFKRRGFSDADIEECLADSSELAATAVMATVALDGVSRCFPTDHAYATQRPVCDCEEIVENIMTQKSFVDLHSSRGTVRNLVVVDGNEDAQLVQNTLFVLNQPVSEIKLAEAGEVQAFLQEVTICTPYIILVTSTFLQEVTICTPYSILVSCFDVAPRTL